MFDAKRDGFSTLTPYLMVESTVEVVEFLKTVFDAEETLRTTGSGGGTHVEVRIGDSMLMIGGDKEDMSASPASFFLYVEDVDSLYQRAIDAGGETIMEPADDRFKTTRGAGITDPFGNQWFFAKP